MSRLRSSRGYEFVVALITSAGSHPRSFHHEIASLAASACDRLMVIAPKDKYMGYKGGPSKASFIAGLEQGIPAQKRLPSMDGDCAGVKSIAALAARYDAWTMVDDAHGFGVLGERGAGLLESEGLDQTQVPILMATLGKAAGTAGAFVAGSDALIETLIQQARPYIFTTAQPPAIAAATLKAIDLIERETWRRDKLHENIGYFRQRMQGLDLELLDSRTAIQPVVIGDNHRCLRISEALFEQGIHVTAIRPPTVPEGGARLRITLSAAHESGHIDALVDVLGRCIG